MWSKLAQVVVFAAGTAGAGAGAGALTAGFSAGVSFDPQVDSLAPSVSTFESVPQALSAGVGSTDSPQAPVANVTVKTTDDYLVRLFAIAFTKRRPNQIKKTTYAQSSQIRAIRKKMANRRTR